MVGGRGGGGGASTKVKRAACKILERTCASFSCKEPLVMDTAITNCSDSMDNPSPKPRTNTEKFSDIASTPTKNICAICLDPLSYGKGASPNQAIFIAQCSHAFHFACISSNVRHGNVTCPICRAHWTKLPRSLNTPASLPCTTTDPILQILDESIATFRVHRRSFLRSARYDDDDPIEPDHTLNRPRLHFTIIPVPNTRPGPYPFSNQALNRPNLCHPHLSSSASVLAASQHFAPNEQTPYLSASCRRAYLSVTLAQEQATDLVLVASPNGPHLRLVKQSMALVVFSLRPIDRLAIVTYSSSAARVFPLRRMTSCGKRAALQVIDRLLYTGQANPTGGLKKGLKVLDDRAHKNPQSCILHLSDTPTTQYYIDAEVPFPIHQFYVGFGFGNSSGLVMHEFEEFLARVLGGVIRDIELRIREGTRIVKFEELRAGEERRIALNLGDARNVCLEYSYVEGGVEERVRNGEIVVDADDKSENDDGREAGVSTGGRTSNGESWDYHDPCMARRWAKHLQCYRL